MHLYKYELISWFVSFALAEKFQRYKKGFSYGVFAIE